MLLKSCMQASPISLSVSSWLVIMTLQPSFLFFLFHLCLVSLDRGDEERLIIPKASSWTLSKLEAVRIVWM